MSALHLMVQAAADTATAAPNTDPGAELIAFWILAPLAVLGAIGMVFSRSAVHSALWLVLTMLCLGCLYINQNAEFLGFVQIIVYTGAIMMLFLFVLMLTGRDSGDSAFRCSASNGSSRSCWASASSCCWWPACSGRC